MEDIELIEEMEEVRRPPKEAPRDGPRKAPRRGVLRSWTPEELQAEVEKQALLEIIAEHEYQLCMTQLTGGETI